MAWRDAHMPLGSFSPPELIHHRIVLPVHAPLRRATQSPSSRSISAQNHTSPAVSAECFTMTTADYSSVASSPRSPPLQYMRTPSSPFTTVQPSPKLSPSLASSRHPAYRSHRNSSGRQPPRSGLSSASAAQHPAAADAHPESTPQTQIRTSTTARTITEDGRLRRSGQSLEILQSRTHLVSPGRTVAVTDASSLIPSILSIH